MRRSWWRGCDTKARVERDDAPRIRDPHIIVAKAKAKTDRTAKKRAAAAGGVGDRAKFGAGKRCSMAWTGFRFLTLLLAETE